MGFFLGVFGTDFFLALSKEKSFLVVFVGVRIMMVTCFGSVLILLLFIFVRVLSFVMFCFVTRVPGQGVFFGMVGCLLLLVLVGFSPWATSDNDIAVARLERMLGPYSESICGEWVPSDRFLADLAASDVSDQPDVWAVSFVLDELSGVGVGGCGVYSLKSGAGWFGRRWRHLELLLPGNLDVERCVLFDSVRGPLQSVQRAQLWEVILPLQCSSAVHLGVDNLEVVGHVSRILDGQAGREPFGLTIDGDLLTVIERIILQSGVQSVRTSQVKGHADDDMVAVGRVRVEDKSDNDLADRAADFWEA